MFKEVKSGETTFITEPREVVIRHSKPWETIWSANDIHFDSTVVPFFGNLRQVHLSTAHQAADEMDIRPEAMRATLKQFSGKTAIGADQHHLRRMSMLPDAALESLGAILKQSLATLTVPAQEMLNALCLLCKKLGGSRTIVVMSSIYRALMKHNGFAIRE